MRQAENALEAMSDEEEIAAAVAQAWERARGATFQRVDKLEDAAIALLENTLNGERAARVDGPLLDTRIARRELQSSY